MKIVRNILSALRPNNDAVAMTEFALATPLLLTIGIYGVETTNLAMTHMRISQVTMQIADNASRIGDTSTLQNRKIYENDINDLLYGADVHAGEATDLFENGRVIISSLETVPSDPSLQYIHWQRCKGKNNVASSYGEEGDGDFGKPEILGMGPADSMVRAPSGGAVMFVEVVYEYQPLINDVLINDNTIRSFSAFIVRDDRDLSDVFQRDALNPDPVADCATFDSFEGGVPVSGGVGSSGGTSTSGGSGSTTSTTSSGSTTTTTTTSSSGSSSTTTTTTSSSGTGSSSTTTTTSSGGSTSTSSGFPWF